MNIGAGAIRRRALSSLHTAVPSVAQQCTAQLAMRRRVEDRRAKHSDRAAASLGGGSVLRAFISKAPAPRPTGVGPRAHNHLTTLALASTQRPRTHRRYHPPPRIACYAGVRPRTSATGATGERTQSCTDLRRAQANVSHALPPKQERSVRCQALPRALPAARLTRDSQTRRQKDWLRRALAGTHQSQEVIRRQS